MICEPVFGCGFTFHRKDSLAIVHEGSSVKPTGNLRRRKGEKKKTLSILFSTHEAAQAVRMKQENKNFSFSGDEPNAKRLQKAVCL